jgi:hypothetical protein
MVCPFSMAHLTIAKAVGAYYPFAYDVMNVFSLSNMVAATAFSPFYSSERVENLER